MISWGVSHVMIALAILATAQQAKAADIFYFTSAPTAYIGAGQTRTLTGVSVSRHYSQGAYTNSLWFTSNGYEFDLVGPNLSLPTVGHYANATRWPFMGDGPGMAFMSPGRGNNTLTGSFDVLEASYNPDGSVLSFAVDFTQFDEGQAALWNKGSVRYNSALPVPEPGGVIVMGAAMIGLMGQRRRHAPARISGE